MTARTIPDQPTFANESERVVWTRVRDALPGDAILLANVRLVDEEKDHEADLIALLPGVGAVVLEVKGGGVWFEKGKWWQGSGGTKRRIHPVEQASKSKYAVRSYIESDPRWGSRGRIAWAHGVVTPYSPFGPDFAAPDCPRWALHDKNDLDVITERLEANAKSGGQGSRPPTHDDIELIHEILLGRGETSYDYNAEAQERKARADRLTVEQLALLKVTRLLHRVEIRGGAGTGKTVLALAQAKELTAGMHERKPQRVALVCYSVGLAQFMQRQVETWPRHQRPAFVGTYEDFGHLLGAPAGDYDNSDWWERKLPVVMAGLAADLPEDKRFDAFVIDEAQDFADSWWNPIVASLRDEEDGGLYVYSDENQRIFARFGRPPVPLVPLVLDDNLRNTKQIHEAFAPLAPTRMTARGSEGPVVSFLPSDDPFDTADEAIDILIEAGWSHGNIALLATGSRHQEHLNLLDHLGLQGYWRTLWEDDVFYGHVLGFKGLERPAVVLCVNEDAPRERSRERLYVGMSRATDQLIVVGNPKVVAEIGGPEVAKRLGISPSVLSQT